MSNRWLKGLGLLTLLASLSSAWAYASPRIAAASPGTGALLGVASSSGRVRISAPSSWRELALPVASSRSVDARFSVGVNSQPSGRGANVLVVARRSSAGEYRVRAHIAPDWRVTLSVV